MNRSASEYKKYFKVEKQAKICFRLANNKNLDVAGLVHTIAGDLLTLELVGSESVEEMTVEPGTDVFITYWTGWSLCRCSAVLMQKICGRQVSLRLTGPVNEKQTREFFRLDVSIPICYTIPEMQVIPTVHEEWDDARELLKECAAPEMLPYNDGFKVVRWNNQGEVTPCLVNLSGGGIRFKTKEYVKPGCLVTIDHFLPLNPPRVIHTVAETLRCSEIVLGREKGSNFITALRFHFINDKDRETIIAFIFAEQRRMLSTSDDKRY